MEGRRPRLTFVGTASGDPRFADYWAHEAGRVAGFDVTCLDLFPMPNLDDVPAHLLEADVSGPVNLGSPHPERNVDVVRAVGAAFHRPTVVPVPAFALRLVLGEFSSDITGSQRMVPKVLTESGFDFAHADIGSAAAWLADQ